MRHSITTNLFKIAVVIFACFVSYSTVNNMIQTHDNKSQIRNSVSQINYFNNQRKHDTLQSARRQLSKTVPNVLATENDLTPQLTNTFKIAYNHPNNNSKNNVKRVLGNQISNDIFGEHGKQLEQIHVGFGNYNLQEQQLPITVAVKYRSTNNNNDYYSIFILHYSTKSNHYSMMSNDNGKSSNHIIGKQVSQ